MELRHLFSVATASLFTPFFSDPHFYDLDYPSPSEDPQSPTAPPCAASPPRRAPLFVRALDELLLKLSEAERLDGATASPDALRGIPTDRPCLSLNTHNLR